MSTGTMSCPGTWGKGGCQMDAALGEFAAELVSSPVNRSLLCGWWKRPRVKREESGRGEATLDQVVREGSSEEVTLGRDLEG